MEKKIFTLFLVTFCLTILIAVLTYFRVEKQFHPIMAMLLLLIYLADCFIFHLVDVVSRQKQK